MKIESLPQEMITTITKSSGFKLYLNNLLVGRPATPRSRLYEDKTDTEVLEHWMQILNELKTQGYEENLVYQYETSFLEKFGPQGLVPPVDQLMDLVTEGFSRGDFPIPEIFRTSLRSKAKDNAVRHLIIDTGYYHRLRPRALSHVLDDMKARDTLESNSGYPDFGRRNRPDIKEKAIQAALDGSWKEFPAITLFRSYNGKTRIVWMYPLATNLVEGSFTQPLKEAVLNTGLSFFAPWRGFEHVQNLITKTYQATDKLYLSASDFSHTDAHFTHWAMLEVFDVIKHFFQPQYWEQLKDSMLRVVSIPLIIGPDKIITGRHGVSSGSNWTNDVETYLDYIAEEYLTLLGLVDKPHSAIGDDISHVMSEFKPGFAEQAAKAYQEMGFDVNAEKVTNERNWVKYLQRLFVRDRFSDRVFADPTDGGRPKRQLRGVYRTIKALNSSLNPEKFHSPKLWSKDMFAVRQFMILENCIDHPLFEKFVKFVCDGHPYLREFARKSTKYLDKAYQESRLIPGLNATYNQEKRDKPLSSFASINVAKRI